MESQIENTLLKLKEMLGRGQFLEAMDTYLAEDVILQEANNEPKIGKQTAIQVEKELLATVTHFGGYEMKNIAIKGNTSYL